MAEQKTLKIYCDNIDSSEQYDSERYKNEEWMREEYVEERRSSHDIADELNISKTTVLRWLDKHGIKKRSSSETKMSEGAYEKLSNEEWLRQQYIEKKRTTVEIGNELSVSDSTVGDWLRKHDIEPRSLSEHKLSKETHEKLSNKEWLVEQYVGKRRGTPDIAAEVGVTYGTVVRWLEKYDVDIRATAETELPKSVVEKLRDESWITEQYIDRRRASNEIAADLNVAPSTVIRWVEKHGIDIRTPSATKLPENAYEKLNNEEWLREKYNEMGCSTYDIATKLNISIEAVITALDRFDINIIHRRNPSKARLPEDAYEKLSDKDWLQKQYVERRNTTEDIADDLDVSSSLVSVRLKEYGISTRSSVEYIESFGHKIRSGWEYQIAELLIENDIEYEYEEVEIEYTDENGRHRTYTPDFVTDEFIIEVKGRRQNIERLTAKAEATMKKRSESYIVIGNELPCDIHIEWGNEAALLEKF